MAVAEARAAWQRTVHRCLVQEDAKRAPKLACVPSASPCSKEVDVAPRNDADAQDIPSVGLLPFNWNPSYYSISPNSRWWMHSQPGYRHPRGLTSEQPNCEESEMKISQSPVVRSVDESTNSDSAPGLKNDVGSENLESERSHKDSVFEDDSAVSKETDELFPWIGDGKTEPWWRITDEDELALLVAQRSFGLIENCDLPHPQNSSTAKRKPFLDPISIDHEKTGIALAEPKHPAIGVSSQVECQKQPSRRTVAESDSSKAELLEALRHSQTRAREAERAAKEAYEEKEHVVKLVFRQASQLFAYKQWFELLQIKNDKEHPITGLFPLPVPWMPQKPRRVRKNWQKGKRGKKTGHSNRNICKCAVFFALGLSLVGGLFLGWSMGGWMLPTF